MPSWNTHLEAGNRLANKLKLTGKSLKEFLLGCLLPDINNGYVNKVSVEKPHQETHYAYDQKSSLNFYADHQKQIDDKIPIFLGYLFHLYTDGYFNYNFYHNIKRSPLGEGLDHDKKREIKHHDFWIYDTTFHHHLGLKNTAETASLANSANQISTVKITPSDIEDVERLLLSDEFSNAMKGQEYLFYDKSKLDALLDEMIESFSNDYLGAKDA